MRTVATRLYSISSQLYLHLALLILRAEDVVCPPPGILLSALVWVCVSPTVHLSWFFTRYDKGVRVFQIDKLVDRQTEMD